jgi:hypothetical protein
MKRVASNWAKDNFFRDDRVLREVEESFEVLYNSEGFGYMSEDKKTLSKDTRI